MPERTAVTIFAVAWFVLGIYHLAMVCSVVLGGVVGEMGDAILEPSCQGSQCHQEWRDSFGTCKSERRSTFYVRYLTVAVLGILFGWMGISGTNERDNLKMKSFGFFQMGMAALFGGVLLGDLAYVEICSKMSSNMGRDVLPLIPAGEMDRMRAQGYRELDKMPIETLKKAMGYDFVVVYAVLTSLLCVVLVYLALKTISIADKVIEGPLGLGPMFLIQSSASKDEMAASRQADDIMGQLHSAPAYGTLPQLVDGQRFPYVTLGGESRSINYGFSGAPKQAEVQDPRFPEYLGVMGL